jgi:uncharacterized SAM-dependent methyltransferase
MPKINADFREVRMRVRNLNQQDYISLKAATRKVIKQCGGLEMAARETRVGVPTLSDYQNTGNMECFIPVDVLADLMSASESTTVLDVLAIQLGCIMVRIPDLKGQPILSAQLARILKETGDVLAGAGQALTDNKLSPREAAKLVTQIDEALASMVQFRNSIVKES